MARKATETSSLTLDRAIRIDKMLRLLASSPRVRNAVMKKLKIDLRSFYRDMSFLRSCGVTIKVTNDKYALEGSLEEARFKVPFPNPRLNLEEAQMLAKGNSAAHKKLKKLIDDICGDPNNV